jgi:hypothetical protein
MNDSKTANGKYYKVVVTISVIGLVSLLIFALFAILNPLSPAIDPQHIIPDTATNKEGIEAYSQYMAVRNIAIALVALTALVLRERRALGFVLSIMGLTQLFDGIIGISHHSPAGGIVPPFILGTAFLLSARYLFRHTNSKV